MHIIINYFLPVTNFVPFFSLLPFLYDVNAHPTRPPRRRRPYATPPTHTYARNRSVSPASTLSVDTLSVGGGSRANSLPRPTSPSPSVMSDKTMTQEDPAVSTCSLVSVLVSFQGFLSGVWKDFWIFFFPDISGFWRFFFLSEILEPDSWWFASRSFWWSLPLASSQTCYKGALIY